MYTSKDANVPTRSFQSTQLDSSQRKLRIQSPADWRTAFCNGLTDVVHHNNAATVVQLVRAVCPPPDQSDRSQTV
eukprot:755185-Pyramimonas_sp.AAC.1